MAIKKLILVPLFFIINNVFWDYLVLHHGVNPQWASFYSYLMLFLIIFLLYGKKIYKSFCSVKKRTKSLLVIIGNLLFPMIIGYGTTLLITYVMKNFLNVDILPQNTENIKEIQGTLPLALTFIMMTIFAPIIEEVIFRESFLSWVDKKKPLLLRIMTIVSVVVFAGMHIDPSRLENFVSLLYYLPLSVALTYVYLKNDREIFASVASHSITNLFAFIFMLIGAL